MRTRLLLAALVACTLPALAQTVTPPVKPEVKTDEVKTDTVPQPTTANDMAVVAGTDVQTTRTAEDNPPAGPPAGHVAQEATATPQH